MHILGATAAIINDGQVLLTRRGDFPLWVFPGGHLNRGETLQACCLREINEETGLDVEITRLAGLYAPPRVLDETTRAVTFLFACRVVGGSLSLTTETTAVRYWPPDKLPTNIPNWHRRYLNDALQEDQATVWRDLPTPMWVYLGVRPFFQLRRWYQKMRGHPRFAATRWRLGAFVTLFDTQGQVLLVRRRDYPVWNLPGGKVECHETPWKAAVRETYEETGLEIQIERLTGVYSKPSRGEVVLNFEGRPIGGRLVPTAEGTESRYFPINALPDPILPKHVPRIYDSAAHLTDVVFEIQDTPSGLKVLGFK